MAVDPAKTYHGKPCKQCGGTLRYRRARGCIACGLERQRERERERYANDPEYVARKRQRERERCNDPEYVARKLARSREQKRERYANDREYAARKREQNRERHRKKRDERILADPTIQEYLRLQNPLVKKLEAMIADAGASQGEKDNAYRILERKGLLPTSTRRHTWLRRQTTFGATPNTQHETKSLPR